jgi:YfiH family protein
MATPAKPGLSTELSLHPQAGVLTVPQWMYPEAGLDWLWHGFSTRESGVSLAYCAQPERTEESGELNLGFTADDAEANVRENRARFRQRVSGDRQTPMALVRQVHSNVSIAAGFPLDSLAGEAIPQADGIISQEPGLLIAVQTADCIPVLVVDPVLRVVGAFHAGWRGTVERIVELGVRKMQLQYGSEPSTLTAAIGPGIGACCYTVGQEVLDRFAANFEYAGDLFTYDRPHGQPAGLQQPRLDLPEANRRQLIDAGLSSDRVQFVGGCTACQPKLFYSHRASGGRAGRMMAAVGVRGNILLGNLEGVC